MVPKLHTNLLTCDSLRPGGLERLPLLKTSAIFERHELLHATDTLERSFKFVNYHLALAQKCSDTFVPEGRVCHNHLASVCLRLEPGGKVYGRAKEVQLVVGSHCKTRTFVK